MYFKKYIIPCTVQNCYKTTWEVSSFKLYFKSPDSYQRKCMRIPRILCNLFFKNWSTCTNTTQKVGGREGSYKTYMHTRHIYAAPRFVIYNTEKKIKYKVLDQLAPLKLIYPLPTPLHSFFSPQRTLIHLYIKTKSFVHNAPIYNTGKYCCFNCSTFFFVTEINMLLSEQTFIRFEIESCFFFCLHCVFISIQIRY